MKKLLYCLVILCWFSLCATQATITFNLDLYREVKASYDGTPGEVWFFAFPSLNDTTTPISYHRVEAPVDISSATFGPTNSGGGATIITDFAEFADKLTNGNWKLWLNKGTPSEQFYTFTINTAFLTSNNFGHVTITAPLDGASNVSSNTAYAWSGPAGWNTILVEAFQEREDGRYSYDFNSLPPNATTWASGPTIDPGTNFFEVRYIRDVEANFTISTPSNPTNGTLSGWVVDRVEFNSTAKSGFVVGGSGSSSLGDAVDAPTLSWTTGGDAPWFSQAGTTFDDIDAAQSGAIDDDEESWIETEVTGPGILSFWWKVSSEDGYDYLEFSVDGGYENDMTGDSGWSQYVYNVDAGTHTLRWHYYKDSSGSDGDDAGYLDNVTFTTVVPPEFTRDPFSQTNYPGYDVSLFVEASGDPTPTIQWYKNGNFIPGATAALYIPASSGTAGVAGNYFAVASNDGGSTLSATATISFQNAPLPPGFSRAVKGPFTNLSSYYYGSHVDNLGNVYVAAEYSGSNSFGTNILITTGSSAAAVVKHSPTGAALWARGLSNAPGSSSYALTVAAAPGDGVYLGANFQGTNYLGTNFLVSAGMSDILVVRFDALGNTIWTKRIGGTESDFIIINSLTSDSAGNVTISGLMAGTIDFGGSVLTVTGQKCFLVQYDSAGAFRWLQTTSGYVQYMVESAGSIYFSMLNNSTNSNIGTFTNVSSLRYSIGALNGANGEARWMRGVGSLPEQGNPFGYIDDVPRLAVTGTNLFVVGTAYSQSATFESSGDALNLNWPDASLGYFVRYGTNGTAYVAKTFGGENTKLYRAVSDASSVWISGDFDHYADFGGKIIAAPRVETILDGFVSHAFVAKFDFDGNSQWALAAKSPDGLVNFRGLALGPDGVWASGFFKETGNFGTNQLISASSQSPFTQYRTAVLAKVDELLAGTPVALLNPQQSGPNLTFQFVSQAGHSYTVEARPDIATGAWSTVTNVAGDGDLKTIAVPASSPSTRFFRVRTD